MTLVVVPIRQQPQRGLVGRSGFGRVHDEDLIGVAGWVERLVFDPDAREAMRDYRALAIPASAIADAIAFAIGQPPTVDVNEIIVRPAASTH